MPFQQLAGSRVTDESSRCLMELLLCPTTHLTSRHVPSRSVASLWPPAILRFAQSTLKWPHVTLPWRDRMLRCSLQATSGGPRPFPRHRSSQPLGPSRQQALRGRCASIRRQLVQPVGGIHWRAAGSDLHLRTSSINSESSCLLPKCRYQRRLNLRKCLRSTRHGHSPARKEPESRPAPLCFPLTEPVNARRGRRHRPSGGA